VRACLDKGSDMLRIAIYVMLSVILTIEAVSAQTNKEVIARIYQFLAN
jgi:hypothetical protein